MQVIDKNFGILQEVVTLVTNVIDRTVYSEEGKGVLMGLENVGSDSFENVEFVQEVTASIVVKKIREKFNV